MRSFAIREAAGSATTPVPAGGGGGASRNSFLDVVRTVAILRVLVWHTFGFAWISYLVASMPAMFFVAGALMARSLDHGGWSRVLFNRFRRLLLPLWAFGAIAFAVMVYFDNGSADPARAVHGRQILTWIFPIWDPQGSEWGISLWAVLWYLRCLTWLLLASPLLLWIFRRTGPLTIAAALGSLAYLEYRARAGDPLPWQLQDFALYAIFWLLGYAYNDGWFARLGTGMRVGSAALFAALAATWSITQPMPGGIVNASYPAHLLVGLAWLFAALSAESAIARFAVHPFVKPAIAWVNDRALTIYLWHAAGLFCMYQICWSHNHPYWLRLTMALPIVLAVTFVGILVFGWLEDVAARRTPRVLPGAPGAASRALRRSPLTNAFGHLGAAGVAGAGLVAMVAAATTVIAQPAGVASAGAHAVPPSGVGISIRTAKAQVVTGPPPQAIQLATAPVQAAALQSVLDDWLARWELPGATIAVRRPDGTSWSGASGLDAAGSEPALADTQYPIASVTKTFTAALILDLAEDGRLSLDDPLSGFVPDFPAASNVTIRQLLQHTSGIPATDGLPPDEALDYAAGMDLDFVPGTRFEYSTPAYFLLGIVIENLTGTSVTEALHMRLLDPLGLDRTAMDEEVEPLERSTHPSFLADAALEYHGTLWSSAGLYSTVDDLARWALALWDGSSVITPASRAEMTDFLPAEFQYTGLATYPFCPCWKEGNAIKGDRWGHLGSTGVLEYDPRDRLAIAIHVEGLILDERLIDAYDDLSAKVRGLVHGRELPAVARLAQSPDAHPEPAPDAEPAPETAAEPEGQVMSSGEPSP